MVTILCFFWVHRSLDAARLMELQGIRILGLEKVTPGEVLKLTELKKGMDLLEIKLDELVEVALTHPRIRKAKFKKIFPNRLEARIEERSPVLQIYSPFKEQYFLIDQDGVLLPDVSSDPHPEFLIYSDTSVRPIPHMVGTDYHSSHIIQISEYMDSLKNSSLFQKEQIQKVYVNEIGFWTFVTREGIEFRVGNDLNNLGKIRNIETLLHSDVRGKLHYLDLRFQDVIVKLKKKGS